MKKTPSKREIGVSVFFSIPSCPNYLKTSVLPDPRFKNLEQFPHFLNFQRFRTHLLANPSVVVNQIFYVEQIYARPFSTRDILKI